MDEATVKGEEIVHSRHGKISALLVPYILQSSNFVSRDGWFLVTDLSFGLFLTYRKGEMTGTEREWDCRI